MKALSQYRDGISSSVYEFSDYVNSYVATGASQAVTVPAEARYASFAATGNFYVKFVAGGTAAIPAANVTDGTSSTLNPTVRRVEGLASFAIIAAAGVVVQVSFYMANV
jgi:hypothetical protein